MIDLADAAPKSLSQNDIEAGFHLVGQEFFVLSVGAGGTHSGRRARDDLRFARVQTGSNGNWLVIRGVEIGLTVVDALGIAGVVVLEVVGVGLGDVLDAVGVVFVAALAALAAIDVAGVRVDVDLVAVVSVVSCRVAFFDAATRIFGDVDRRNLLAGSGMAAGTRAHPRMLGWLL